MSTIFVIEDNEQNARLVTKLLEHAGYTVEVAETGEDAITLLEDRQPELVLVDLGLPDMDGQTVVAYLRQQPHLDQTPIIAFTAWPRETAFQMAQAYGCDGVITKPLDTRAFIGQIEDYLKRVTN